MSFSNLLKANNYNLYCHNLSADGTIDCSGLNVIGNLEVTDLVVDNAINCNSITAVNMFTGAIDSSKYSSSKSSVTQTGAITDPVTATARAMDITTVPSTLGPGLSVQFTVNNVNILSTDYIFSQVSYLGTGYPYVEIRTINNGSFVVTLQNRHPSVAFSLPVNIKFFALA